MLLLIAIATKLKNLIAIATKAPSASCWVNALNHKILYGLGRRNRCYRRHDGLLDRDEDKDVQKISDKYSSSISKITDSLDKFSANVDAILALARQGNIIWYSIKDLGAIENHAIRSACDIVSTSNVEFLKKLKKNFS